jgi:hypothetical protein
VLTCAAVARRPVAFWVVRIAFVLAFVYTFPYWEGLHNANEVPRVFLTEEIVDHGTFRLDARWPELARGSTFDVSITPDGHKYSNKAPGTSLLGVPAYLAVKAVHAVLGGTPSLAEVTWACRILTSTLPVLGFLVGFRRSALRFASPAAADGALVAVAFGSMVYPYAHVLFSHALAAACAGGGFVAAMALARGEARRPIATGLLVGFLLGWSVLADYQSALALLVVVVYLGARSAVPGRDVGLVLAGGAPPATLFALYHWACFGAPWRTGYSFAPDPAHKQGALGVIGPNLEAIRQALVAPDNGLIVLMPWVVLAVIGFIVLVRRPGLRAEAVAMAAIAAGYVLFVCSLVPEFGRAGWSVGPRYIVVSMPFFGWLAAVALDRVDGQPVLRAVCQALVLSAVVVMVTAATTFPYWPTSLRNPVYEVAFWALATGHVPHSLGTASGLSGAAALVPLYVIVSILVLALFWRGERGRIASTATAAILAAALVFAMGFAPRTRDRDARQRYLDAIWEPRPRS